MFVNVMICGDRVIVNVYEVHKVIAIIAAQKPRFT